MIQGNLIREVRFRDGYRIAQGELILISWPDPKHQATQVQVYHRNHLLNVPAATALSWINVTVSLVELETAILERICKTPNGYTVEPDGIDPEGAPS